MVGRMNRPVHRLYLALLAALLVAGCSSSQMSRIDANRALYQSWPFEIQEAVLYGRIVIGMTPEMVEMVLGKPANIMNRSGRKGDEEVWIYKKGGGMGSGLRNTNISMGGNIGGVGVSGPIPIGGGSGVSEPAEEHDVVFQKGVVIRADPELSKGK